MKFKLTSDGSRQVSINVDRINAYCSRWKPGTVFDLEVVRRSPKRSDPQRAMYFAAILPEFAKGIGHDPEEYLDFHRDLKIIYFEHQPQLLLKYKMQPLVEYKPGRYRNVPSVFSLESPLPVAEKAKFISWALRKAGQEGIYIEGTE